MAMESLLTAKIRNIKGTGWIIRRMERQSSFTTTTQNFEDFI